MKKYLLALLLILSLFLLTGYKAQTEEPFATQLARNDQTDNLNILFLAADQKKLLTAAVLTVNYHDLTDGFSSAGIFFPIDSIITDSDRPKTLAEYYKCKNHPNSAAAIRQILQELLSVDIAYYVHLDKRILHEVQSFAGPVTIDDQEIALQDIFEIPADPKDQEILEHLVKQCTKPSAYFYSLPAMLIKSVRLIQTDFPLTAENLWLHFKIAKGIDMANIQKRIVIDPKNNPDAKDIIYQTTYRENK